MRHCFMALHEFALFPLSAISRMLHIVHLSWVITFHVVMVVRLHLWVFRSFVLQGVTPFFPAVQNRSHVLNKPLITIKRTTASLFPSLVNYLFLVLIVMILFVFHLFVNAILSQFLFICAKMHSSQLQALNFSISPCLNLYSYSFNWLYLLFFNLKAQGIKTVMASVIEAWRLHLKKKKGKIIDVQNIVKDSLPQCQGQDFVT